jgi:hypothetical protein
MAAKGGSMTATIILGLDPSSTCIGYGALSGSGSLIEAGVIRPPSISAPSFERILAMHDDLVTLLDHLRPGIVLVEWTKGKVGKRHGGLGAGLAVYGCGVGAVGITARQWASGHSGVQVHAVLENTWTRGVPKRERQLAIATEYPSYAEFLHEDIGGDIADGIGLAAWWLAERKGLSLF